MPNNSIRSAKHFKNTLAPPHFSQKSLTTSLVSSELYNISKPQVDYLKLFITVNPFRFMVPSLCRCDFIDLIISIEMYVFP